MLHVCKLCMFLVIFIKPTSNHTRLLHGMDLCLFFSAPFILIILYYHTPSCAGVLFMYVWLFRSLPFGYCDSSVSQGGERGGRREGGRVNHGTHLACCFLAFWIFFWSMYMCCFDL